MIRRLPHVDRVGVEERAAQLGRRSIKTTAKQQGIRLAVSMVDLTTLEGADTAGKVRHLCAKGVCPAPTMPEIPSVAAICVYPSLVAVAKEALNGTGVRTASVATGFPAGQVSLEAKLRDTEDAVAAGADEIDMVISREAFLAGGEPGGHGSSPHARPGERPPRHGYERRVDANGGDRRDLGHRGSGAYRLGT